MDCPSIFVYCGAGVGDVEGVLTKMEPDWQETVIEIITSPPVNQIFMVSSYIPTAAEVVPITSVERPPVVTA